jgi:hypothetical protein
MAPPTNQELNEKREKNCVTVTVERKYYKVGNTWIKRSLRPSEWQKQNGFMHVPLFNTERILNEGECLEFLAKHTDIPLPRLIACFEDDSAAYLITEYVDGVGMNELDADGQAAVAAELQRHMQTLKGLTSDTWGGPSGVVKTKAFQKYWRTQANPLIGASAASYYRKIEWSATENASSREA